MTIADTEFRSAKVNGVNLRYVEAGTGDPTILFVHGWTCNLTDWRFQLDEFAEEHRVVALDLRGHGKSDKPDQDYTIDGFADDVVALSGELGLERPVMVGHSMGGAIAHNIVRRRPEVALGVVLVDSNIMPPPEAIDALVTSVLAGLKTDSYKDVVRTFVPSVMFNEGSDPAMKEQLLAGMIETPQRVIHTALASLVAEAHLHEGPMPVPTLLLRASTRVNSTEEVKARFPNIEVQEIEGAHFLQLERPKEVNDAIRDFIRRLTEVTR
jgi:pimeloyl-ACP methyl ester carboxylesterase